MACGQPLFDVLEVALDIERHPSSRHFEPLAPALPFELAILLERARTEPAERADRNQRRERQQVQELSARQPSSRPVYS